MLKQYVENQIILKEDDKDTSLYKVVSGHVEVYTGYGSKREHLIGILSEGSYFGEIGAFTDYPSIYTVVAYDDCVVMGIEKEKLEEYAGLNHMDMLRIMTNMANTMVNLKTDISLLMEDLSAVMDDNRSIRNTREIRDRIRNSDITKQLVRYNIQMNYKI